MSFPTAFRTVLVKPMRAAGPGDRFLCKLCKPFKMNILQKMRLLFSPGESDQIKPIGLRITLTRLVRAVAGKNGYCSLSCVSDISRLKNSGPFVSVTEAIGRGKRYSTPNHREQKQLATLATPPLLHRISGCFRLFPHIAKIMKPIATYYDLLRPITTYYDQKNEKLLLQQPVAARTNDPG